MKTCTQDLEAVVPSPYEQLGDLERAIRTAVPPIDPPGCHWLVDHSGTSYCWPCARAAAWNQMPTMGPVPDPVPSYMVERHSLQEMLHDRIDGPSWGNSDTAEYCDTCECMLAHLLSDSGQDDEIAHYRENPVDLDDTIDGEMTYALSRTFMNLDQPWSGEARTLAAIPIAEAVLAAIAHQGLSPVTTSLPA